MTVITAGTMFYSCETTELEDLVSPNALSADLADADHAFGRGVRGGDAQALIMLITRVAQSAQQSPVELGHDSGN